METFLKILKERKISVKELSEQSGVPFRTIQAWIYNGVNPTLTNAEEVLEALGYSIEIIKKAPIEIEEKTKRKLNPKLELSLTVF